MCENLSLNTLISDDTCYFSSEYKVWFAYVNNWGAYQNEFGIMHEKAEIDYLIDNLPKNATMIDVGANYGVFSLNILSRRRDLQIYAFEPVRKTNAYLEKNIKINNFSENVLLTKKAVGSKVGTAFIEVERHTNNQIIGIINNDGKKAVEEVEVTDLDSFVKVNDIKSVSAQKTMVIQHKL